MSITYFDCETTGLDPAKHHIWEMAYAIDDGPIESAIVPHTIVGADLVALEIGGYDERSSRLPVSRQFEHGLATDLDAATLCCANPAFDAAFLRARWGVAPWKYRLFDIEAYAMGALGYEIPQGLATIRRDLDALGYVIPEPDHTAIGDVATLRECHRVLRHLYGGEFNTPTTPSHQPIEETKA